MKYCNLGVEVGTSIHNNENDSKGCVPVLLYFSQRVSGRQSVTPRPEIWIRQTGVLGTEIGETLGWETDDGIFDTSRLGIYGTVVPSSFL